jgi:CRP-like cAMP-binding protein
MLRYVQAQLVQAAQSAACNAKHNMEQRLARWLLPCTDRAHAETLKLSQKFLADMLGSTRPTVSIAAGTLREEGLIDYNRGVIRILDAKRLEERTCECYHVIKDYLDNHSDVDSTFIS